MSWLRPAIADRQLIDYLAVQKPEVLALARWLAPALRIEPRLLRNCRLAFLPQSDAGLEAVLWQCSLVASSSARGLTLKAGVARLLTNELAQQPADYSASLRLIESNTAHWNSRERLEQSMRLDVLGPQVDPEALRQKLRQVLRELIKTTEPKERVEIARWAKGALPQLIDDHHPLEEAALLAQFTAAALGDPGMLVSRQCKLNTSLPGWLVAEVPTGVRSHTLGLRWRPGVLECLLAGKGSHTIDFNTPFPVPVFLQCEGSDPGSWELFWPERKIPLPVDCSSLLLHPLAGVASRLSRQLLITPQTSETPTEVSNLESREDADTLLEHELYRATTRVSLRLGPGVEYEVHPAGHLSKETLTVGLRHSGDWILVELPEKSAPSTVEPLSSRQGWVRSNFMEKIEKAGEMGKLAPITNENKHLLAEIALLETPPMRRLEIGNILARLGNYRKGVGLDAAGLPDIDWVEISAGIFMYGKKREKRELPTFYMTRHPITNAQYQTFIDAGGYREGRWWEGLAERIEQPEPPHWTEPNRPRETVNFYEAMAFCRWLSDCLDYEIRLPTEEEWEKAARGTDGREYPWGNGYKPGYCNVNETTFDASLTFLRETTAVGLYPQGASPYGVEDMAGNIWEWCLNEYKNPVSSEPSSNNKRVLRGGSWLLNPEDAKASFRFKNSPALRNNNIGFRVVCLLPLPH